MADAGPRKVPLAVSVGLASKKMEYIRADERWIGVPSILPVIVHLPADPRHPVPMFGAPLAKFPYERVGDFARPFLPRTTIDLAIRPRGRELRHAEMPHVHQACRIVDEERRGSFRQRMEDLDLAILLGAFAARRLGDDRLGRGDAEGGEPTEPAEPRRCDRAEGGLF